jgi:hypothetical protein
MTALKTLGLGVLVWGALGLSAPAAPVSSTGGAWSWWSPVYSNAAVSGWSPDQIANLFYGPSSGAAPLATAAASALPSPIATSTPASSSAINSPAAAQPLTNAFINVGAGPYPLASQITTGGAQPWYNSSQLASFFGGQPTAQQQADFDNTILQRVQQTFQQSGVPITLTESPNVPAAHTLSLVSNTTSNTVPGVIGMTQVGGSGFSFIDQEAKTAQTLDQLQWIVAHNIAHELMLAFGVGEKYDQTGNYIDARNANFAMMVSPNSSFSPGAIQALLVTNMSAPQGNLGAQEIVQQPVPEPMTLVLWLSAGLGGILVHRRRSRRS